MRPWVQCPYPQCRKIFWRERYECTKALLLKSHPVFRNSVKKETLVVLLCVPSPQGTSAHALFSLPWAPLHICLKLWAHQALTREWVSLSLSRPLQHPPWLSWTKSWQTTFQSPRLACGLFLNSPWTKTWFTFLKCLQKSQVQNTIFMACEKNPMKFKFKHP
jgi:hypothetical protein